MRIGIDLDDVMAICSVPYLRRFAQEFNVESIRMVSATCS